MQTINIGAAPNDGTGDPLRTAFDKVNQNFAEVQKRGGAGSPEGVVAATGPDFYIQTKLTPTGYPGFWVKPAGSTGNTGWVEMLSAS